MHPCSVMSVCNPPGSPSRRFSRQEYWSGLLFPPAGDLSNPGTEPMSSALAGRFFATEPPRMPQETGYPYENMWTWWISKVIYLHFPYPRIWGLALWLMQVDTNREDKGFALLTEEIPGKSIVTKWPKFTTCFHWRLRGMLCKFCHT